MRGRGSSRREKDRRGARRLERRAVLAVDEERQLARLRIFDPGDAGDFKTGVSFDGAAKFFGDFSEFHDGLLATLPKAIATTDEH